MLVQYAIIQQILVLAIVVELCLARFFFIEHKPFFFRELNLDFRAKDRVSAGEVEGERGNHE